MPMSLRIKAREQSGMRKGLRREEAEGGDLEPKGRACLQGKQRHQCVPCPREAELRTESGPLDLSDGGQEIFWNSLTKSLIAVGLPENDRKGFGHSKHGKLQEFYPEKGGREMRHS